MEKQALEKMRTEFPEVWEGLLKDEFAICLQAIKRKAQIIRTEERRLLAPGLEFFDEDQEDRRAEH